ncbi:sugar ABC transporter permease [Cetobacterium somerae]|uniref:carbohydrate ABC transporter permease n=2 Tax=Cetobacterium TaxID=180162 RepID=UPI001F067457|nr:sugar ABC transporter permease [Cetobacterium somerae]UPO97496.1 sugar ABC transporter permease [Cetobacterium somerae]
MKDKTQRSILLACFLAIPTILLFVFVLYPGFKLALISFTDWDGINPSYNYVGLKNYTQVFQRKDIWQSLKNNNLYFMLHLFFIPIEMYLAMLLDRYIKKSEFFKTIVFMPYIINGVAIAYMFSFLYSSEDGVLNGLLALGSIGKIRWLSDPKIVNYSLVVVSLWRFTGVHIILFLAGLQSINKDMLEAALIDGASVLQQFVKIIMPNMKSILSIVLFLNVRGALMVFDIPFVMTSGGPGTSSTTFALHTVKTAFEFSNFGLACAMAIVLIVAIIVISIVQGLVLEPEKFKGKLNKIRGSFKKEELKVEMTIEKEGEKFEKEKNERVTV